MCMHHTSESLKDLSNRPQLRAQDTRHHRHLSHINSHISALVLPQPLLPRVVLGQDLLVLQTYLLYFDQKFAHAAGQLADILPPRVRHLLLLVDDLEMHLQRTAALLLKTEPSLAPPRHRHLEEGLVVRPAASLSQQLSAIVEDQHVGSPQTRIVVVREEQYISLVFDLKIETRARPRQD